MRSWWRSTRTLNPSHPRGRRRRGKRRVTRLRIPVLVAAATAAGASVRGSIPMGVTIATVVCVVCASSPFRCMS